MHAVSRNDMLSRSQSRYRSWSVSESVTGGYSASRLHSGEITVLWSRSGARSGSQFKSKSRCKSKSFRNRWGLK